MYQKRDSKQLDEPTTPLIVSIDDQFPDREAFSGELQHLFRSKRVDLTSGVGQFNISSNNIVTTTLAIPCFAPFPPPSPFCPAGPPPQIFTANTSEDVEHTNLYLYSYIKLPKNVTVTLGASGDFFNTDSSAANDTDQFNPKFGVTWNPVPATTVRAAAFRVLKRTLITDQTLEPTQVAGFNQFFDDLNSTKSWRFGAAIDQKFSQTIFGGLEFSYRDLDIPFKETSAITGLSTVRRGDADEYLGRTYLFWTPHKWFALGAEYQYEQFLNSPNVAFFYKKVATHQVPLGVKFFHPSGLGASLKVTYYDQDGKFKKRAGSTFDPGDDAFWLVDAAISYRLPKRYGFITVGATNLTDNDFEYQETDLRNLHIVPDRVFFANFTVTFP